MSNKVLQYFLHYATIDGTPLGGSQSVSISKNVDSSDTIPWGSPFSARSKFRKKPTTSFSITKMLSDDYGPTFSGFDVQTRIPKRPVDEYDVQCVYKNSAGGFTCVHSVLTGVSYSFSNQGWFTEELTFEGVATTGASYGARPPGTNEGTPYQRQNYLGGTLPSEVSGKVLLGIDVNLSIPYGEISSFGSFNTYKNKFIQLPVDISVTYEVLDLTYSQTADYAGYVVNDDIIYQSILISTTPVSIDLGSKNFLSSIDRSGANAGDSDYSIMRYTYRNLENYFKLV